MTDKQVGMATRTEKEKVFVSVGRLEAVKDQDMMIRAFGQFHNNHPDYKLVIYGEGPNRPQLGALVNSLGLEGAVLLPGRNNNVWNAISSAECFLLSSKYEGMSNAMVEALCLGLPVISTKVAGATEIIKDGENGYLVDVGDANAMAKYMCQIADDNELRQNLSAGAVKVYELFRADRICEEWVDYLDGLME